MGYSTKTAQYDWKSFKLILDGKPIAQFTDLEITPEKNLEDIYGAGDTPQFIGEGNKSYTGSIEFLQSEYEALVAEAKKRGGDDITDLEMSAVLAYVPKGNAAAILTKTITDRIVGMKFSSAGKKMTQGATHFKMSVPFRALRFEQQI